MIGLLRKGSRNVLNLPQYTSLNVANNPTTSVENSSPRYHLELTPKQDQSFAISLEAQQEARLCFGFEDGKENLDLTVDLKPGSHLKIFRYGSPGSQFSHSIKGNVSKNASLEIFELYSKPMNGHIKSQIDLSGEGAEYTIHSFTDLDHCHMSHQGLVRHLVPNTFSNQQHRFCLNGASKGNYEGDVFIEEGSSGVRANQLNQNLVLHPESRMHTKPQLQIFHDDVKCTHGATITQPNPQQLFYLNSRGISPAKAMGLLHQSFREVIMNLCHDPEVLQEVQASFGV